MTLAILIQLYGATALYTLASAAVLAALFRPEVMPRSGQTFASAGFLLHSGWLLLVSTEARHLPITNLPEIAGSIAWLIVAVKFALDWRYRTKAAGLLVYPMALFLMAVPAILHTPSVPLEPRFRSHLFTSHLALATVGVAVLLLGLLFSILYYLQEHAIRAKRTGRLWEWMPSLRTCETVSYRALAIGFTLYTLGLLAGVLWSYRSAAPVALTNAKEFGALLAWILSAVLLQAHVSGSYRTQKAMVISAAAFVAIVIALMGISHV